MTLAQADCSYLADVITLQRGFDLPESQRQEGDVPVVASTGVIGFHSEKRVTGPGVLIGRSGSIGGGQYIPTDFWPLNTTLWVKDFKGHRPRFVYYMLRNIDFTRFNAGSGVPTLNRNHLDSVLVPAFNARQEERIADVLSAYDDLIENNRRRIALLEEAARQLYREWFLRLRFPGHEHTRVTNGIPDTWQRKSVEELSSFLSRGIAPHYDDDAEGRVINQKCIRGGRLDVSLARHQSRQFKSDRQVQQGDVLVNSTGEGTLGRVAQVLAPIDNCTADTHVTIIRPATSIGIHFFGQSLMEWEPRFSTMGRGATNQTELSRGQIGEVEILVPNRCLMQQFEEATASPFRQVWVLMQQNEKLCEARDLLLPRLMSGDITV